MNKEIEEKAREIWQGLHYDDLSDFADEFARWLGERWAGKCDKDSKYPYGYDHGRRDCATLIRKDIK